MLIIATYADYNEMELKKYAPSLVYVDNKNKITITKNSIDIQAA
jgi:aspartate 1-decarboxylase